MVKPLTYGRMGNFLFQAACAMSYAWKHKIEFTLPNTTKSVKDNPIYLQHLVNAKWNPRLPEVIVREKSHAYQDIPYKDAWRGQNIILDGYWQSEKYFLQYRDRLLEAFRYPWESWKGIVSLHVRRGDYLTLRRKHPEVTIDWMKRAMAQFPGMHFYIFSDDLAWCRETFGHRKDVTIDPEPRSEEDDLIRMSWSEHHICSASTFSWWAAWLNRNPDKRIIMPTSWFTPGYQRIDTSDIVPSYWQRLP